MNEASNRALAPRFGTWRGFTIVDQKPMLKIAELAAYLLMVAQAGAAGLDRRAQHLADRGYKAFAPFALNIGGKAQR